MKYVNHMSEAQLKFIRWVRDGHMSAEDLMRKQRQNPKQFSRWFRNKYFWHNVKWAAREALRRSWLKTKLTKIAADDLLHEAVREKKGLPVELLETCHKVKEHERADTKLELSLQRARGKKKPPAEEERDLVHPEFKEKEEELLKALERDGHAASGC